MLTTTAPLNYLTHVLEAETFSFQFIQEALQKRFDWMVSRGFALVYVDLGVDSTEKILLNHPPTFSTNKLWTTYLNSLPPSMQKLNRCWACHQFIKYTGGLIGIDAEYNRHSLWDIEVGNSVYDAVFQQMNKFVLSCPIQDMFLIGEVNRGIIKSLKTTITGNNVIPVSLSAVQVTNRRQEKRLSLSSNTVQFHHFYIEGKQSASYFISEDKVRTVQTKVAGAVTGFKRSLVQLSTNAVKEALEAAEASLLPRSEQMKPQLERLLSCHEEYKALSAEKKEAYVWSKVIKTPEQHRGALNYYNSFLGTFIQDLTDGMDFEVALKKLEGIEVGYKVPKESASPTSIKALRKALIEGGYMDGLSRRLALLEDVPPEYRLFSFPSKVSSNDPFDLLTDKATNAVDVKTFSKVTEIGIKAAKEVGFFNGASLVEILPQSCHRNNLITLLAPVDKEAKQLTPWSNGNTWCFIDGKASSSFIKEKVKQRGGNVTGDRFSLAWEGDCDLDLHLYSSTSSYHVFFGHRIDRGAKLDVDANAGTIVKDPVENIFLDFKSLPKGTYTFKVHNFNRRFSSLNKGFQGEFVSGTETYSYDYSNHVDQNKNVNVVTFSKDSKGVISIVEHHLPPNTSLKQEEVWGVKFNTWQPVVSVCSSPNYWEGRVGNEFLFFLLQGASYGDKTPPRAFFNEMIVSEIADNHKRALASLGSMLQVDMNVNSNKQQATGLGFNTSESNSVYIRVDKKRIYKVNCQG